MKKVIVILVGVLILVAIGGGIWFWSAMQQPLYEPGMVRAINNRGESLVPPAQSAGKDYWLVENEIQTLKQEWHKPFAVFYIRLI